MRVKQSQTYFIYGYTPIHMINAIIALKGSCVSIYSLTSCVPDYLIRQMQEMEEPMQEMEELIQVEAPGLPVPPPPPAPPVLKFLIM